MPKQATVSTDWIIVATSGDTADGRFIKKEWLTEMAETYDPEYYSAKIWLDHYRWYGSQGSVLELKTGDATAPELKGEIHLFARLAPTDVLISENRAGRYRHASIEPLENFANTGKTYLGGLGFTDSPASLGTSEALFSKNKPVKRASFFPGAELDPFEFSKNDKSETAEVKGLLTKLFNLINKPDTSQDDEPMNEKQFSTLQETLTANTLAITTLVDVFKKSQEGDGKDKPEPATTPTNNGVTTEQFTAQGNEIKELKTSFEAFSKKLDDLIEGKVPGTESDHNGGETQTYL